MRKWIYSLICVVGVILISSWGISVKADSESDSVYTIVKIENNTVYGECGTNVEYSLDINDGTMQIYGSGKMYDCNYNSDEVNNYWNGYEQYIKSINVGDGVTRIGACAFMGCLNLTSVNMSESVTEIGMMSFESCCNLTDVVFSQNIEDIDILAFAKTGLASFECPEKVKAIYTGTFSNCENLKTVVLGDNVRYLGLGAFGNDVNLERVVLPNSINYIAYNTFDGSDGITVVGYKYSMAYYYALAYEKQFESLGDTVKIQTIYSGNCGSGCSYTLDITTCKLSIEGDGEIFSDMQMYYMPWNQYSVFVRYIEISNGVTSIGRQSFAECGNLISIIIPESVISISDYVFNHGRLLSSLIIIGENGSYAQSFAEEKGYIFQIYDCTEENDQPLYTSIGYQLVLNGRFELRYYLKLSDSVSSDENSHVDFQLGDEIQSSVPTKCAEGYVYYSCKIPAKNLIDKITVKLLYQDMYYCLTEICVRDYLETIISNSDNNINYELAKNLAMAILEYGSYAQEYFDYHIEDLADSKYSANKVSTVGDDDIPKGEFHDWKSDSNSDFQYVGASLVCTADIGVTFYFINNNKFTLEYIEEYYSYFVVGGSRSSVELKCDGDYLLVTVRGIPVAEIGNYYNLVLWGGDKNIQIEYAPMKYVEQAMECDNIKLKNLCKALYLYGMAAEDYFDKYTIISEFSELV